MRVSRKLQHTVIICFCLFGLILTTFYGTLVFLGLSRMEDRLFKNQLESIVEQYLLEVSRGTPTLTPPGLVTYVGTDAMPADLFELVGRFPIGYHELHFERHGIENELQVIIQRLPKSSERIYFIYDVKGIEVSEERQFALIMLLFLAGVLVCCFGLGVGYMLSRKIVFPLKLLTRKVEQFSGQDLPLDLVVPGAPDEINFLGKTLGQANERINRFIAREKEFTRNASHELRTPLTVIQGAAELLEKRFYTSQEKVPKPLARINRSVFEMEVTIETFLMLAREEDMPPAEEVDLNRLCKTIIADFRELITLSEMDIQLVKGLPVSIVAPPQVIRIVLSNLLRNAIQHSSGKTITVQVSGNRLQVSDDGCGMTGNMLNKVLQPGGQAKRDGGTGFGLTIVDQICTQLGWELDIQSNVTKGTTVTVLLG